jgi:transcription antitermination protein NusB
MLNRRILRIKVMQTLYALKQTKLANYYAGLDYISDVFSHDPNSMEKPDLKKLEGNKKLANLVFEEYFEKGELNSHEESPEIKKTVEAAIKDYHSKEDKDKKYFGKLMMEEIDRIYDLYLFILHLPLEFPSFIENEKHKLNNPFKRNRVIDLLSKNPQLSSININWTDALLVSIYKAFKEDQEMVNSNPQNLDEEKKLITHLFKALVLKNEEMRSFFEEKDINWNENKSIVKNMVVKTIKAIEPDDKTLNLLAISTNWEEDKAFFNELYEKTLKGGKELEKIVSDKIKNWDIERVAAIDKIILELAICEMINFPSIPVKVTINEYIEISKLYSTPKSKQFINGILDTIAIELSKNGIIKKSGRGLIDNK